MTNFGNLRRNMVLLAPDEGVERAHLRVLEIRWEQGEVALLDIDDPVALPFWSSLETIEKQLAEGDMEPCDDPLVATMRKDSDLTPAELAERNRRYTAIALLVEAADRDDLDAGRRQRFQRLRAVELLEELRQKHGEKAKGPRADRLLGYFRLYWRGGQLPNALVPRFLARGARGRPRVQGADAPKIGPRPRQSGPELKLGVVITQKILDQMQTSGLKLRMKRGQTNKGAYEAFIKQYFSVEVIENGVRKWEDLPSHRRPTQRQFLYHTDKLLKPEAKLIAQKGLIAVMQRHRGRTGTTHHLFHGPGSVYQIDATVANIYLRSRFDSQRFVGRPVVYFVVDMYSKAIVGFAVALYGPSWESAASALTNAFSDKVAYCKRLSINIESHQWPQRHTCAGLMGDRGWDHLSQHAGAAQRLFGYKLVNLPRYRPDLKGLVEDKFNFLDLVIKFKPGEWRKRPKGEPPHTLDGAMNLPEFERFMVMQIMKRNDTYHVAEPPQDWDYAQGIPTPNMLWQYGLTMHGTPDEGDMTRIWHASLRTGTGRISDNGIMFNGLPYVAASKESALPDNPHLRSKGKRWQAIEVRHATEDMSRILVPVDRGERLLPYVLHPGSPFRGWTFDELTDWNASSAARKRDAVDRDASVRAHWDAQIAAHDRQVQLDGVGEVRKTKRPHTDRDARAAEAEEQKREQARMAFGVADDATGEAGTDAPATPPPTTPRPVSLRPNRISLLEQASAESMLEQQEDQ